MAVKSYTNMYLVLMKKYVVCNVRGKYILNCMGMHHYLAVVAFVFNLMIPLLCTKDWATFSIPKLQQLVLSAFALPVCVTFQLGYKSMPAMVVVQGSHIMTT